VPEYWVPVITRPDPVSLEEWLASDLGSDEPPGDGGGYLDPEGCEPPWDEDLAAVTAESDRIAAERALDAEFLARAGTAELAGAVLADEAEKRGPRGPGLPGSAEPVPGVSGGPAGGFAAAGCLDTAAGSAELHGFVERAVDSGRLGEVSEDEIVGLIAAADRAEAAACSLKHAAAAELIRRRPAPGCKPDGPARMPESYLASAGDEVKWALAETRQAAHGILSLSWDLEVKLPGTRALFRDGRLRHAKVQIIARETAVLDPGEAREAEELVLGDAPGLSPGALRGAIGRAVARINPEKARDRRERGARDTRVERWREHSGNAALAGRELPPARVLAADQRITWRARQLQAAGADGDLDQLRGRALTDLILDQDSRPPAARGTTPADTGEDHPAGPHRAPGSGTWRLTTGIPGQRAWIIDIDPIPAGDCNHRYQATGHDPGTKLRHLAQIRHATLRAELHHRTHPILDLTGCGDPALRPPGDITCRDRSL
jgi:hypothetical protein